MLITDLPHTQSSIISMLCADADLMKIDNANVETILNIVAQEWGLKGSDLLKKTREKRIREPRQFAQYFLREHRGLTLKEVGQVFGNDHTTIIHNVRAIGYEISKYGWATEKHDRIKRNIFVVENNITLN